MTYFEASQNIGKSFKIKDCNIWFKNGSTFDTIRKVTEDGIIIGDMIEAHCDDCRLKQEQPEQLKKAQQKQNSMEVTIYGDEIFLQDQQGNIITHL